MKVQVEVFSIKFKQSLIKNTPKFSQYHIEQPIRWGINDPLESFVFDAFLLDSFALEIGENYQEMSQSAMAIQKISAQALSKNELLLRQVFSVLVTAHYQTTPSDLKLLLNNAAVRLYVILVADKVIGVALTLIEGMAEEASIQDVAQAKRRMKNQFIPQSLFVHNNCQSAFDYQYLRIMRIAVLPQFQQQGIGSRLLSYIQQDSKENGIDILGTSYGANEPLLNFWHKAAFNIIRVGFTLDKASGEYSTLYLLPLSMRGKSLVEEQQRHFFRQFTFLLTEQYQQLSPDVVLAIIRQWPNDLLPELSEFDQHVVHNFMNGQSLYDNCIYSLHISLIRSISTLSGSDVLKQKSNGSKKALNDFTLLIQRVLQKHDIETLCIAYGLTGKKQFNQRLQAAFKKIVSLYQK